MREKYKYKIGTLFVSTIDEEVIGVLVGVRNLYHVQSYEHLYKIIFPNVDVRYHGFFRGEEEMNETEVEHYLKVLYEPKSK